MKYFFYISSLFSAELELVKTKNLSEIKMLLVLNYNNFIY